MAVRHGHGKVATDGLVFAYDTGDTRNSYKGEPVQNLWDDMLNTQSLRAHTKHYWDGRKWIENATYSHPGVDGPKGTYLGLVFKHTSGALNSSWSNNSYGYMLRDIACTNGATMTMSSWIYASTDCDVTAIPAVIEQEAGGESTVSGYPASYDLNNKGTWQVVAKKATSDGQVRFIPLYPRKDGVTDGSFAGFFMWALPQVTYGDHVVQPIQPGTTRSATESLLDLTGNSTVDLSSVSFDSDAQITFDGTDDDINAGPGTSTSFQRTIEMVFKTNTLGYLYPLAAYTRGGGQSVVTGKRMWLGFQNNKFQMHGWGTSDPASTTTIQTGQYYHAVYAYDQVTKKHYIWINGVLEDNSTNTQSGFTAWNNSSDHSWFVGGDPDCASWSASAGRSLNGEIPVFKVYDRILSNTEVAQNFNHYKTRFGI